MITGASRMRNEIHAFLAAGDLECVDAASAEDAAEICAGEHLDGIVIDWAVSEVAGVAFIEQIQERLRPFVPPVIVLGPAELDSHRAAELRRLARASSVRYAPSIERLLDETVLLLHRREGTAESAAQQAALQQVHQVDPLLVGRKVLVVDDDLRNIFALTSVLEQHNIEVLHAETGRAGIEVLTRNPGVDLVLMDIMMPEMDGYETTRAIRRLPEFAGAADHRADGESHERGS